MSGFISPGYFLFKCFPIKIKNKKLQTGSERWKTEGGETL